MPPSPSPSPTAPTWARAADLLAERVNRRARVQAVLRRLGPALLVAAALALLARLLGWRPAGVDRHLLVAGFLVAGAAVGLLAALRALRRVRRVSGADAAWALDRLAGAGGRGLAAAATHGPAASEAAFTPPALEPPPAVRLLPPHGLVPLVATVLLAVLAFAAPARSRPAQASHDAPSATPRGGAGGGPGAEAARAEARAAALDAREQAARRARTALGLPAEGPLDPAEVQARLSDPEARRKARAAAGAGALAHAAASSDASDAQALARLLATSGDNREVAAASRRKAAAARARAPGSGIPAGRRALVERYLHSIGAAAH